MKDLRELNEWIEKLSKQAMLVGLELVRVELRDLPKLSVGESYTIRTEIITRQDVGTPVKASSE